MRAQGRLLKLLLLGGILTIIMLSFWLVHSNNSVRTAITDLTSNYFKVNPKYVSENDSQKKKMKEPLVDEIEEENEIIDKPKKNPPAKRPKRPKLPKTPEPVKVIENFGLKTEKPQISSTTKQPILNSYYYMKKITIKPQKYVMNFGLKHVQEAENYYYEVITKDAITCPQSRRVGRNDDGGWDICTLENLKLKQNNCLSYSFGVNYIWEFDDQISTEYGCIVRTFDPSMTREPNELQRASKVWFYKIGLGNADTVWSNGWKIMKMSSLLKKFNEENKIIDILKIDIEFSEWDSFEAMIEDGVFQRVKQLMFETHTEEVQSRTTSFSSFIRFLKVWNKLYDLGFRQWKHHWNHFGNYNSRNTGVSRTCCFEHYLINKNYL